MDAPRKYVRLHSRRQGAALLVCLFVMSLTTVLVVTIVDTQTLEMTALRNVGDYERANYLAAAAVHHACSQLEQDDAWRTGIPSTVFPSGSGYTYSATVVNGTGSQVIVTGIGVAGGITRTLQVTVDLGG